ncbi:MAG: polysaccharide pyruvyl transferase family protein [Roseburia sp.]|nr:polysaccharide pyruvyl transferase family protein [Roseburia sp.]
MVYLIAPIVWNAGQNWDRNIETKIHHLGGNTGNLVWFEAVRRKIRYDMIGQSPFSDMGIKNIIFPMANQINIQDKFLESWCLRIKDYHGRITMIGLGAQLTDELNTPKKLVAALPQEQKWALKELGSRTETIGIRGSITAECLELMGITNYRVIGCPSFYMKCDAKAFSKKVTADKLCVSWGSVDYAREQYVREFFRHNASNGGGDILLLQAMDDFPRTLYEGIPLLERHIKSRYPDIEVSPDEIASYIKMRGHIFFDWDSWQDFLKREQFTLSVGCRFHGNMMSYLAGIPTLWIVHDSRTYELCEAMALPYITLERAAKMENREQFAECCVYGENFHKNRKRMQQIYEIFLHENGIERV